MQSNCMRILLSAGPAAHGHCGQALRTLRCPSHRPQAAGTTQNNPLKTNGPKNPDPSTFAARFSWRRFHLGAKKFAPRRCVNAKARKSSPCALKTPQIRRFCACWASFFAERPLKGPCWASFFAEWARHGVVVCSKAPSTSCHLRVGLAWWNARGIVGFEQWIMKQGRRAVESADSLPPLYFPVVVRG